MSLPIFPDPPITRDEAINSIVYSIAMEELGLSHIINAEGEKIQYVLGTLKDISGPDVPATVDDLLKINDSVRKTLEKTAQNNLFLKDKMETALSSNVLEGKPGKSAYEIALEQGFVGTEKEWLASLKGEKGPAGTSGSIIPFASKGQVALSTITAGGTRNSLAAIGFGDFTIYLAPTNPVSISGVDHMAFSVPEDGVITKLSAYYNSFSGGLVGVTTEITAQLFYSETPDNIFQPLADAFVKMQFVGDASLPQRILFDNKDLNIPVTRGSQLFLGFYNETPGWGGQTTVTGYMSGSIKIE